MNKLVILGAGGYGNTVRDIAEQLGYTAITVLDDSIAERPLASFVDYLEENTEFIPAFGNNEFRMEWIKRIEKAGGRLATLIHPTAYISPKASIYPGTVILPHGNGKTKKVLAITHKVDEATAAGADFAGGKEMLEKINGLGIGPGGLGGSTTALAVNINTYATHIAGLPVAINICCHVNRHVVKEI